MYRIRVLSIYFGKLPTYFNLWIESCRCNPTIDFLIITDQEVEHLPPNVIIQKSSLEELRRRFNKSIGMSVKLDCPYKLCDLKPMYGVTFKDEFQGYDFWGHCDLDLIWGNLRKFLPDEILARYDKIFPLGHLSLYRNNSQTNEAFRLSGSRRGDYTYVLSTNKSCIFDETYGIDKIFEHNHLPFYDRKIAADISFRNQRMLIPDNQNKNYPHQLFLYKNGHILRAYEVHGSIRYDEFAYIHLQKRKYARTINSQHFIIGQNQFIETTDEITLPMIKKYNPYRGYVYERIEYFIKDYSFRIGRRMKQLFVK